MIKFFRRIRQSMITQNKFSKYLLYAIGEIILVVIGILIALQINNNNEARKANLAEVEFIEQIIRDLTIDSIKLQGHLERFIDYQAVHSHIYNEIQGNATYDSLIPYRTLRTHVVFDLIVTSNHQDKARDLANVVISDSLKEYFRTENLVKSAFIDFRDFKNNFLKPYFDKHVIHNTQELFNYVPLGYESVITHNIIDYSRLKDIYGTVELDQILFNLGIKAAWNIMALEDIQKENKKLKKVLEQELESRK